MMGGGPVLVAQWTKSVLEALGVSRLDISSSSTLGAGASAGAQSTRDEATAAAAWRLLEAGDTLTIGQVETLGLRLLLRRARELHGLQAPGGHALESIEQLAQLLALWRPGAHAKERESAYFDARFAREPSRYAHPSMAQVLDPTFGQLLFADQVVGLLKLLGFDHAWGERFRRALAGQRGNQRYDMERELRA